MCSKTMYTRKRNIFQAHKAEIDDNLKEKIESLTNSLTPLFKYLNLSVFIILPTSAQIWQKAVFKVGPVAGPKPTLVRHC